MIKKDIKTYESLAKKIMLLANKLEGLSDSELKLKTTELKTKISKGARDKDILPEAFAVVVEANNRVLGLKPYFVQIVGGIALYYGNVIEMKTGEGKTLVGTMPLYLHALFSKGNYLITSNEYLANRDAVAVGKIFEWLNLSVAVGVSENPDEKIDKKKVYSADIIYTTHSALGFDYLLENLATNKRDQVLSDLNFAVIDEVDSVLLDMAQTPLLISGGPKVQSNFVTLADWTIKNLDEDTDFESSENGKNIWFTEEGIFKMEKTLGISKLLSEENKDLYSRLVIALKANHVLRINKDYVVEKEKVILLDQLNGRKLHGSKLQTGLHQALEAKEIVPITKESSSLATITYQNLFQKFKGISGMTGTAKTEVDELRDVYNLNVIPLPTHRNLRRKDYEDVVFFTNKEKMQASIELVKKSISYGRPVLIETGSITMSRLYSLLLLSNKIPHNLLNASSESKEAWIISEAGNPEQVTVATPMVGRGTDIKLSNESIKYGGLLVLGTERTSNIRIDNQLRGRAGRQGEPGESIFMVSLEDRIISESIEDKLVKKLYKKLIKKDEKIQISNKDKRYKQLFDVAQTNLKNREVSQRKNTLEFDTVISTQRDQVYQRRNQILRCSGSVLNEIVKKTILTTLKNFSDEKPVLSYDDLFEYIILNIDPTYTMAQLESTLENSSRRQAIVFLKKLFFENYLKKIQSINSQYNRLEFVRLSIVKAIDVSWISQLDNIQNLKSVISSRGATQKKPLYQFQIEARQSFDQMKIEMMVGILNNLYLSDVSEKDRNKLVISFP